MKPPVNHAALGLAGSVSPHMRGRAVELDLVWLLEKGNRSQRRSAQKEIARRQHAAQGKEGKQ